MWWTEPKPNIGETLNYSLSNTNSQLENEDYDQLLKDCIDTSKFNYDKDFNENASDNYPLLGKDLSINYKANENFSTVQIPTSTNTINTAFQIPISTNTINSTLQNNTTRVSDTIFDSNYSDLSSKASIFEFKKSEIENKVDNDLSQLYSPFGNLLISKKNTKDPTYPFKRNDLTNPSKYDKRSGYPQHNDNNFIRNDTYQYEAKHNQDMYSDRYISSGVFTANQIPQTQRYNMQSDTLHNNEQSFKRFEGGVVVGSSGSGSGGSGAILNSHSLRKTVNPRLNGASNHVRNSWNKNDRKFKKNNTKLDSNRVDPNAPHLMKLNRKAVADETMTILRCGVYKYNPIGPELNISEQLRLAVESTVCYLPEDVIPLPYVNKESVMMVEVIADTTLNCCKRIWKESGGNVGCLAYASAKNPGGGFLSGSGGQEESIARSSGYYLCAAKSSAIYEYNRINKDPFHSEHVIVSTNVPVIRDEAPPHQLTVPWPLSIIAAPAVNAGVVRTRLGLESEEMIHQKMRNRIRRVLAAAHKHGVRNLILGEYGCGALENNPRDVAQYFKSELMFPNSPFAGAFDRVIFAIHDEIGSQNCGRQKIPCLPYFYEEICPGGKRVFVKKR